MNRMYHIGSIILFVGIALIGSLTLGDQGQSWDEEFRFKSGGAKLDYYQSLFGAERLPPPGGSYPALFDLPLAMVDEAFPDFGTISEKGHAWSLVFGLLGILSTWRMATLVGGERAGFWALVFLATFPRYYGHMFFNPKDIPLAGTYALAMWMLLRVMLQWPKASWGSVALLGVAGGLAMSTRIAGFLTLCYFGLFVGVLLSIRYLATLRKSKRLEMSQVGGDLLYWLWRGLFAGCVAFALLFIFWPTLHHNPLGGVQGAVETVQHYGWDGYVLMDGVFYEAKDLPFYYVPYWLFITIPDQLLLLGLVMAVLFLFGLLAAARGEDFSRGLNRRLCCLVVFGFAFPWAYFLYTQPVLYDGMRHCLFTLPLFACACALTLEWLLRCLSNHRSPYIKYAVPAAVAASVLLTVADLKSLHPYQYTYFNRISGGLNAAYLNRETDYWGLSYREAAEWLNQYVEAGDAAGDGQYVVHQLHSPWMLEAFLSERFQVSRDPEGADFYVSFTRFNFHTVYPDLKMLHVVERQGVPLCFIFEMPEGLAELGRDL